MWDFPIEATIGHTGTAGPPYLGTSPRDEAEGWRTEQLF